MFVSSSSVTYRVPNIVTSATINSTFTCAPERVAMMSKKVHLNKYLASAKEYKENISPEAVSKINKEHKCNICNKTFNRSYNAHRHYIRFHTKRINKQCCNQLFDTKGSYYDHRELVHNEVKRYGRKWRNEPRRLDETDSNIDSHNMAATTTLGNHTNGPSNDDNCDAQANVTIRRRRLRKNKHPKKFHKQMTTCDQNVLPEYSEMQNIQRNKENVQRYVCKSESEVIIALTSINF